MILGITFCDQDIWIYVQYKDKAQALNLRNTLQTLPSGTIRGRLNIKISSYQYRDPMLK